MRDDARRDIDDPDSVVVVRRSGGAARTPGPVRVSLRRPCVIDARGVALHRWPWRSVLVPHERVSRFDVVVFSGDSAPAAPGGDGGGWYLGGAEEWYLERLVLWTREGTALPVWGPASDLLCRWRGPSIQARAQHLNNELAKWRPGGGAVTPRDAAT